MINSVMSVCFHTPSHFLVCVEPKIMSVNISPRDKKQLSDTALPLESHTIYILFHTDC